MIEIRTRKSDPYIDITITIDSVTHNLGLHNYHELEKIKLEIDDISGELQSLLDYMKLYGYDKR